MISALAIAERLPHWTPASSGRRGVELRCVRVFGRHRVIWEYDGRGGLVKSVREARAEASAVPAARPKTTSVQLTLWNHNAAKWKGAVSEQPALSRNRSRA